MKKKVTILILSCFTASTILSACGRTPEERGLTLDRDGTAIEEETVTETETGEDELTENTVGITDGAYNAAYDFVSKNALKILQYYVVYQEYRGYFAEIDDNSNQDVDFYEVLNGEEDAFEAAIDAFDPSICEDIFDETGSREMNANYDLFVSDEGTNAYFSGIDIVNQFLNQGKGAYLLTLQTSYVFFDDQLADCMNVYGVYNDYALVRSGESIYEILQNMCVFSGYNAVEEDLGEVVEEFALYPGQQTDDTESIEGRRDALSDYLDQWEEARKQWQKDFLTDYGLDYEDLLNDSCLETLVCSAEDFVNDLFKSGAREYYHQDGDVKALFIYQLVDKDNNRLCTNILARAPSARVGYDGKWELLFEDATIMFDKDGTLLYETDRTTYNPSFDFFFGTEAMRDTEISYMTPSGNFLICHTESDFQQGNYTVLEWGSPDGSTKEISQAPDFVLQAVNAEPVEDYYTYRDYENAAIYSAVSPNWPYTDIWRTYAYTVSDDGRQGIYIDMKTGEVIDDYLSTLDDDSSESVPNGYVQISPDYYLDTDSSYVYTLTDLQNPAYDLSDGGGVEAILYDDDQDAYWVMSRTGYYYKLDGDFNYIAEPNKCPDGLDGAYELTPYGVLLREDISGQEYIVLRNENGDDIFDFMNIGTATNDYGIFQDGYTVGFFAIRNGNYLYNLNNFEMLRVTKLDASDGSSPSVISGGDTYDSNDALAADQEGDDAEAESTGLAGTGTGFSGDSIEASGGASKDDATEIPLDTYINVSADDGEWFSFILEEPSVIKMSALSTSGSTDFFHLYDVNGEELKELKTRSDGKTKIYTSNATMEPGTYYIWHAPYVGVMTDGMFWIQPE